MSSMPVHRQRLSGHKSTFSPPVNEVLVCIERYFLKCKDFPSVSTYNDLYYFCASINHSYNFKIPN